MGEKQRLLTKGRNGGFVIPYDRLGHVASANFSYHYTNELNDNLIFGFFFSDVSIFALCHATA